jgi:transposase InsO family protein
VFRTIFQSDSRRAAPAAVAWSDAFENVPVVGISNDPHLPHTRAFVSGTFNAQGSYRCQPRASYDRRRLLHFGVTSHPTAEWTARQLLQAFPWDSAPRYLLRDRDRIYGEPFPATVHSMGILEVLSAPHSPWQNPYCERLIGSIRRECLDHFIVFNERGLHRTLKSYF